MRVCTQGSHAQRVVQATEAKLMAQMEELQSQAVARDKRERRHRHEARQKARVRAAQLALGRLSWS